MSKGTLWWHILPVLSAWRRSTQDLEYFGSISMCFDWSWSWMTTANRCLFFVFKIRNIAQGQGIIWLICFLLWLDLRSIFAILKNKAFFSVALLTSLRSLYIRICQARGLIFSISMYATILRWKGHTLSCCDWDFCSANFSLKCFRSGYRFSTDRLYSLGKIFSDWFRTLLWNCYGKW